MKERSYRESVDFVLSKILMSSANIRSASMIAATGIVRRYMLREDVNLLLGPKEMGELIRTTNHVASSFYRYSRKLGELKHMYLDFENLQALIFPMPDHNVLLVTLEKVEQDVPRIVSSITRLLQGEGLIHES
ncbi:MAG: hypothetical protein ACRD5H_04895 [Nitrososphaerales archaeon]